MTLEDLKFAEREVPRIRPSRILAKARSETAPEMYNPDRGL